MHSAKANTSASLPGSGMKAELRLPTLSTFRMTDTFPQVGRPENKAPASSDRGTP